MRNEESMTSVRVLVFDGNEKNFQSWWIKFQAYAWVKGSHTELKDVGITITEADIDTLDKKPKYGSGETGARSQDKEKQLKLGKRNLLAMAHLTTEFGSEWLLNKIASVSTTAWPGGMAYWLVDQMKSDCTPNDHMAEVEQTRKMNQVKLTSGENPTKLFEQIKAIDNQFSN